MLTATDGEIALGHEQPLREVTKFVNYRDPVAVKFDDVSKINDTDVAADVQDVLWLPITEMWNVNGLHDGGNFVMVNVDFTYI